MFPLAHGGRVRTNTRLRWLSSSVFAYVMANLLWWLGEAVAAGAVSRVAKIARWSPTPLAQAACPDDRAIDRGTERLLRTEYAC